MFHAVSEQTGHRIGYDTAGDSGTPVLLVMGFTMRGAAWRWQIDALRRHHRVAWFDHAGLGESGPLQRRRLKIRHLAQDARAVMDDLGWDRAHVVGISMGGMIAQHIGLHFRPRVRSLTLAATHAGGFPNVLPPMDGIRTFLEIRTAETTDGRLDALARLLFSDRFRHEERERCEQILRADFTREPPLKTTLAQLHAILRHRTDHRLSELRDVPTLIVKPGADRLIHPGSSDRLAELLPHARMVSFDDSGHAVTRQHADEFNRALLEHLAAADRLG